MSTLTGHPKRIKKCAFCDYWLGDAGLEFVSNATGYKFDGNVKGKCIKKNGSLVNSGTQCSYYQPSPEARKLL